MQLYNYFRSSASYRVRIALALKGLDYDYKSVHLAKNEQFDESYAAVSASRLVPLLRDGEHTITQSLAIIEYLEETHPAPALLPPDAAGRARVRSIAPLIACDIQPLQNTSTTRYLKQELRCSDDQLRAWQIHWISTGLAALEQRLGNDAVSGRFTHGNSPGLADCCIVPQCYAARRFGVEPSAYPRIAAIEQACLALKAFQVAAPEMQADAE